MRFDLYAWEAPRGLDPADRDGDVGQGQQAAATAYPGLGAVEAEAMFAQERADETGGDAKQDEHYRAADDRDELVRHNQFAQRPRALGNEDPEAALERVEAEHVAECLGDTEQAGDHRQ